MTTNIVEAAHERVRAAYAPAIGATRADLTTPAVLLDLDILRANLGFMAEHMQGARALDMITRGDIQDAKSICALLLAQKWLERHF